MMFTRVRERFWRGGLIVLVRLGVGTGGGFWGGGSEFLFSFFFFVFLLSLLRKTGAFHRN